MPVSLGHGWMDESKGFHHRVFLISGLDALRKPTEEQG